MKAAYLGPKGTYSQEAAFKVFGKTHTPLFCSSLAQVVNRVANGEADGAVLPIENSTNGTVHLAVDALLHCSKLGNVEIVGYVGVAVRHQLYTRATNLQSIDIVYSHPQVWGQATKWLATHLPSAKRLDTSSTAQAVHMALSGNASNIAALGGPLTSPADPLVQNCSDDPTNTTRFLILRQKRDVYELTPTYQKGPKKWATVSSTNAKDLHTQIVSHGVVPHYIASQPSSKPWKYTYLIEYEGNHPPEWRLLGQEIVVTKSRL